MKPNSILIFAAGFGTRMGPITKTTPKPLIPVNGIPLIDHNLALVKDAGIQNIVVNLHHLADQLEHHLKPFHTVTRIIEPAILETGGGIKNALPTLGNAPVFTMNSDAIFTGDNPLETLAQAWDPDHMDGLLLMIPKQHALEYQGDGDFHLNQDAQLTRRGNDPSAAYVYTGVQIIKTELLETIQDTNFSINLLWNKLINNKSLYGEIHHGGWVDVGHPAGIKTAENLLNCVSDV